MHELPTSLLMFIAYRSAEKRIHAAIRSAGIHDVTTAQGRILAGIGPNGSRLTVIAERAQVSKQTATSLVNKLEAAGYVEREPDPHDHRAFLIRLSKRTLELLPIARSVEAEIEAEWRTHLGERRMAQLRSALQDLRTITDLPGWDA